jgi:hypothetical protein
MLPGVLIGGLVPTMYLQIFKLSRRHKREAALHP